MPSAIEHEATVVTRLHGEAWLVRIRPQASDACRGCALVSSCGPKEKRGESVEVRATAGAFADRIRPGMTVMVGPEKGATARATNLLLMLPLAGLLSGAIAGAASGLSEGQTALATLGGAAAGFVPALIAGRRGGRSGWTVKGIVTDNTNK